MRENGLAERADTLGARMLGRLREFAAGHPFVGDVRGRGLMIGVELVDPTADTPPARLRPRSPDRHRRAARVPGPGPHRRAGRTRQRRRPPAAAADPHRRAGRRGARPPDRRPHGRGQGLPRMTPPGAAPLSRGARNPLHATRKHS
ncbi:hypothetical protein ACFQVA_32545 [Actinomadura keratinilytica]